VEKKNTRKKRRRKEEKKRRKNTGWRLFQRFPPPPQIQTLAKKI